MRIRANNYNRLWRGQQPKKYSYLGKILVHHNARPCLSNIVVFLRELLKDIFSLLFRDTDTSESMPVRRVAMYVGRPCSRQISIATAIVPHLVGLMMSRRRRLHARHRAPAHSRRRRRHEEDERGRIPGCPAYEQRGVGSRSYYKELLVSMLGFITQGGFIKKRSRDGHTLGTRNSQMLAVQAYRSSAVEKIRPLRPAGRSEPARWYHFVKHLRVLPSKIPTIVIHEALGFKYSCIPATLGIFFTVYNIKTMHQGCVYPIHHYPV